MKATAFIIDSLKHPTEVLALRKIYGSAFVAIAVFNERTERIRNTQARLAAQRGRGDLDEYKPRRKSWSNAIKTSSATRTVSMSAKRSRWRT
jgi:hypothetical protein